MRALNASDLGIEGTVNNLGTILVDSTGSFTDIEIQAGGATIAGPGTVTLSGTNARFSGAAPFSFEYGTLTGNGQVTVCLLYTSPSPRDQRGSRMPSSA